MVPRECVRGLSLVLIAKICVDVPRRVGRRRTALPLFCAVPLPGRGAIERGVEPQRTSEPHPRPFRAAMTTARRTCSLTSSPSSIGDALSRWTTSTAKDGLGEMKISAGKYFGDEEAGKGESPSPLPPESVEQPLAVTPCSLLCRPALLCARHTRAVATLTLRRRVLVVITAPRFVSSPLKQCVSHSISQACRPRRTPSSTPLRPR